MKKVNLSKIIKAAGALMAIAALCILFPVMAYAEGKVTITAANGANIRSGAGTSNVVIASGLKNETYDCLGSEKDSAGGLWYKIQVDSKTVGYVFAEAVTTSGVSANTPEPTKPSTDAPSTTPVETEPVGGTVTTDVNVRKGASTEHDVVTSALTGSKVTVNGYYINANNGKKWYHVEFTKNNEQIDGFIIADFVKLEGELVDKVEEPVVEEPKEEPVIEEPPVQEPVKVYKDYEAVYNEEEGVWYLEDYVKGSKSKITDLYDSADKLKSAENDKQTALAKKNRVIIALVVVIVIMLAVGAVVVIKFRRWYFDVDDTESSIDTRSERTSVSNSRTSIRRNDDDDEDDDDDDDDEPIRLRHSSSEVSRRTVTTATASTVTHAGETSKAPEAQSTAPKASVVQSSAAAASASQNPQRRAVGLPEGAVKLPDGRIQMPDGTIRRSVQGTRLPDGNIRLRDGSIIRPDGTPVAPAPQVEPEVPVTPAPKPVVKQAPKSTIFDDDDDMDLSFLNGDSE